MPLDLGAPIPALLLTRKLLPLQNYPSHFPLFHESRVLHKMTASYQRERERPFLHLACRAPENKRPVLFDRGSLDFTLPCSSSNLHSPHFIRVEYNGKNLFAEEGTGLVWHYPKQCCHLMTNLLTKVALLDSKRWRH